MTINNMHVLMLSPINPAKEDTGYKIAVKSDILAIKATGAELTVLASYLPAEKTQSPNVDGVLFDLSPVKAGGQLMRTLRALNKKIPAAVERYYTKEMEGKIVRYLREKEYDFVIIEDSGLAQWIDLVRHTSPSTKIIVRSHNFMSSVTRLQYQASPFLLKPLYYLDHLRWKAIERYSMKAADKVWAITEPEKESFSIYYGIDHCEYLPVSIDYDRYAKLSIDNQNALSFVHLGTLDMKKAPGMYEFLNVVWPKLINENTEVMMHLGGKVTSVVMDSYPNVVLHGYVDDDAEFYKQSRFSVNPQTIGAGVKLKSLVSMASGTVLLSTSIGVEGIDVEHNEHYIDYQKLENEGRLSVLFEDDAKLMEIAKNGRQWVKENHSREAVKFVVQKLLNSGLAE